ncbi:serine/threonine-protein kinase [Streptomyces sp. NL15-2K]|uniref:serine/threonine-protein kinase n=1 Tax=Streptomyces sp. NL15-2K TaxID=376149 RepID=UPI000F57E517|nr:MULTISPECIES: serine/threonine-protein kinase [Actinomycetes]WKX16226.1 serine/threonine-protein kinase [Kutzneria buriramensis]GCB46690.1 protein serine/threonine kinase [Streptomyces sp. NL15-2K]
MQGLLLAGRYRLADPIGKGGMGRVWRAHDEVLHRAVAIKELTAALYVSESDQAVLLARTRAEARAAARINHSAVVTVHDVLDHDGRPWIVMELVEGHSLADAVKEEGRVEPTEAARIGLWVLRALRAAHAAGVLHRDVKPGNVLLSRDRRVLLTDFGIAQVEGDTAITRTGEIVGSVDYLAPERIRGHDPGASSDLWALGATLYTAVEGRSPFRRTTPLNTMQAVVDEEPAEPRYAGPLAPVIAALLHKDPARRPDASEAEQMLAEAAEGRRPSAAQAYVVTHHVGQLGSPRETQTRTGPNAGPNAGAHTPATGTPYRSGTGPTGLSGPPGPSGPSGPSGPIVTGPAYAPSGRPPSKRRRLRTLALVVALAAIIGGGTAVAMQQWDESRQKEAGASAAPSPTPTSGDVQSAGGAIPADWQRRVDPVGFSLYLPKGWKREVYGVEGDLTQIDYTPDGGKHFVRIAVDTSPDYNDPYAHQLDLEQQIQGLHKYQRVSLEKDLYRDRQGARWEYTWTALAKDPPYHPGPRRAVDETYMSRDGVEYAIYMSSPAKDWPTTRKQFKAVLQGWQEKAG